MSKDYKQEYTKETGESVEKSNEKMYESSFSDEYVEWLEDRLEKAEIEIDFHEKEIIKKTHQEGRIKQWYDEEDTQ